jgi:hypothetical protein
VLLSVIVKTALTLIMKALLRARAIGRVAVALVLTLALVSVSEPAFAGAGQTVLASEPTHALVIRPNDFSVVATFRTKPSTQCAAAAADPALVPALASRLRWPGVCNRARNEHVNARAHGINWRPYDAQAPPRQLDQTF